MKPIGGTVYDESGNGNDGTVSGALHKKSLLGDGMVFDGVDDYLSATRLGITDQITIDTWVKFNSITNAQYLVAEDDDGVNRNWALYWRGNVYKELRFFLFSGGVAKIVDAAWQPVIGNWYHLVATADGSFLTVYINGNLTGTPFAYSGAIDTNAADLEFGRKGSGSNYLNGTMVEAKIYNEAKSQAWVQQQYLLGARVQNFKTDFGIFDTVSNVTSGQISNSPIFASTGEWKIVTEEIEGKVCKVLECVSAGVAYAKSSDMMGDVTELAYGSWEWWMYKGDTTTQPYVLFICDDHNAYETAGQDAYAMQWNSSERFWAFKVTAGAGNSKFYTAVDYAPIATWTKVKVTRSASGDFNFYQDDVLVTVASGSNPFNDTTKTTSEYFVLDFDAGDKICLGAQDGTMGIIKQLGVIPA